MHGHMTVFVEQFGTVAALLEIVGMTSYFMTVLEIIFIAPSLR